MILLYVGSTLLLCCLSERSFWRGREKSWNPSGKLRLSINDFKIITLVLVVLVVVQITNWYGTRLIYLLHALSSLLVLASGRSSCRSSCCCWQQIIMTSRLTPLSWLVDVIVTCQGEAIASLFVHLLISSLIDARTKKPHSLYYRPIVSYDCGIAEGKIPTTTTATATATATTIQYNTSTCLLLLRF